jgi:hypothetical protein
MNNRSDNRSNNKLFKFLVLNILNLQLIVSPDVAKDGPKDTKKQKLEEVL